MGRTVYLPRFVWLFLMVKYGKCIGKYTIYMDAMGYSSWLENPPSILFPVF